MKRHLVTLTLVCLAIAGQAHRQNVIFETDMGNDVDDALAIDMLYKYHGDKVINLMAVMLNKEGQYPPVFIDILNTWYGYKNIPIGVSTNKVKSIVGGNNYTEDVAKKTDSMGKNIYKRTITDYLKLMPAPKLYRKLLAKAKDKSVTIVSVGFSTNLALLLATGADEYSPLSGQELVSQKVDRLVVMAGHITDPNYKEYNVVNDIPACQKVFNEWPTPIYVSPFELGLNIKYPARSIEEDFTWTDNHPIVDAYKAYLPKLEDRPTWDLTAVLYAVDPQNFFNVSDPGRITVTSEGCTHYKADAQGKHYYLSVTPKQAEDILAYFIKKITSKP